MPASNDKDLEQRLKAANIDVLSYKVQKPGFRFGQKKIHIQEVITLTDELKMLLGAGVPLMDVIDDERQNFPSDPVREMMSAVYEAMEGGASFSEALEPYEKVFGEIYISLVRVGEQTGQLEEVLGELSEMMTWQQALAAKAKKIMIYPSIVATVVIGVVIMMMIFVVPQLLSFIKEMQGELGFATIALIATSNFVQEHIVEILLFPVLVVMGIKVAKNKIPKFHLWFDENILKLKLIGPIMYKLKIARMANTLATMERAGVGFMDALELSTKVVANKFMEQQIIFARRLIQEGRKITEAFSESGLMPPMALRIIRAGEDSGRMDEALNNIGTIYDKQAKDLIDKIEPTIEPALTIVMATMVGWVMMAVLGPIYDTISKVQ